MELPIERYGEPLRLLWLKAFGVTQADGARLAQARAHVQASYDEILSKFYQHFERISGAIDVVSKAGSTVESLKVTNRIYLDSMFSGQFDEGYFQLRRLLGRRHALIGTELFHFVAAMSGYADTMIPLLLGLDEDAVGTVCAFHKVVLLDQALMCEAMLDQRFRSSLSAVAESTDVPMEHFESLEKEAVEGPDNAVASDGGGKSTRADRERDLNERYASALEELRTRIGEVQEAKRRLAATIKSVDTAGWPSGETEE